MKHAWWKHRNAGDVDTVDVVNTSKIVYETHHCNKM